MNYNTNTFVISIGEHLSAIAFNAPWMHGQPIQHGQAYMILCALHEELFNEIFPWANINNSLQETIAKVYEGFSALVPAKPSLFIHRGGDWTLTTERDVQGLPRINLQAGQGLPGTPPSNVVYCVQGARTYDQCFNQFIDGTLVHVRWALRADINKYLGTQRDYEWYFEYNGNGIVYTRHDKAVLNYPNPEPETEVDLIMREIDLQPKLRPKTPAYVAINLAEHETRGGLDKTTNEILPDKFAALMGAIPGVLNQLYMKAMNSGARQAEISILFVNPMFLRELCDFIQQQTMNLPVKFLIKTEQVQIGVPSHTGVAVHRAFQERSIQEMNRQQDKLAEDLSVIRDRIARRNTVTTLDMEDIRNLAPQLLNDAVVYDDVYVSVNNRAHWYKFADQNPEDLQHPVIGMCVLLSNYIDTLTGHSVTTHQQPTPTFQPRAEDVPIGVVPIYCN